MSNERESETNINPVERSSSEDILRKQFRPACEALEQQIKELEARIELLTAGSRQKVYAALNRRYREILNLRKENLSQLEEIKRLRIWKERYMREVEGLNDEGDPIGGDPPSGLRRAVEFLKNENESLRKQVESLGQTSPTANGFCSRNGGCVCGGDLPRIRESCSSWVIAAVNIGSKP